MASYARKQIRSGINRINCIHGTNSGKEIHFLHANGFNAGIYVPFYEHFGEGFRIFASDIQGHGDSERNASTPIDHWGDFARNLRDVITEAMNPPVVGIGHSLGGYLTYMAAALYPSLFSRLVLIDPVIFPRRVLLLLRTMQLLGLEKIHPLPKGARKRKRRFESPDAAFERFRPGRGMFRGWEERYIHSFANHGLRADGSSYVLKCDPEIEAQFFESLQMDTWEHAPRITCPVLVVRGENSNLFLKSAARRMEKTIADCRIETIPGCGHFIPMEKDRECIELIKSFIT